MDFHTPDGREEAKRDATAMGATITDRGFIHMPKVPSSYGGGVKVYESSAASHPHIWLTAQAPANLNLRDGEQVEAPIHLRIEDAVTLYRQLGFLIRHHYQGGEDPDVPAIG
jgi:hypothetical protein